MANGDTPRADDERANRQPTADELEAARLDQISKTQHILAVNQLAKQEEQAVAPPRNRTYMGPMINRMDAGNGPVMPNANQSPQQFFGAAPRETIVAPPTPTITPDAQAALQSRLAAGTQGEPDAALLARMQAQDQPGTRTMGVSRPPMPTWQDR